MISNKYQARYVRVNQLATTPTSVGILPMSKATIWRKVKNGTFPAPVKISENVTAWASADIDAFLEKLEAK